MDDETQARNDLLAVCRKVYRRAQDLDTWVVANALEARLVDKMSAGWGWAKQDRTREHPRGGRPPRYETLGELRDLVTATELRSSGDKDTQLVCAELGRRIAAEEGLAPDSAVEAGEESSEDRRRRQRRESARRNRT